MRFLGRVFVVIAAYVCSVIGLLIALAILFGLASQLSFAPAYWAFTSVTPVLLASAPFLGAFAFIAVVVLSAIPMFVIVLFGEIFEWRASAVYPVPAAILGMAVYWMYSPRTIFGIDTIGVVELVIFGAAGAIAGVVYWGLAGRKAGSWRRVASHA